MSELKVVPDWPNEFKIDNDLKCVLWPHYYGIRIDLITIPEPKVLFSVNFSEEELEKFIAKLQEAKQNIENRKRKVDREK